MPQLIFADSPTERFRRHHDCFVAQVGSLPFDPEILRPVEADGLTLPQSPRDWVRFVVLASLSVPHADWMAYVTSALDAIFVSTDALAKIAWSLDWSGEGLDKVALMIERGAPLAHVLAMATLFDQESNPIVARRYEDRLLDRPTLRRKTRAAYADFLSLFDVANRLSSRERALAFLNTRWHPSKLDGKSLLLARTGLDWPFILRHSLVKQFFGLNRSQTDDVSWRRGDVAFGNMLKAFRPMILDSVSPEELTEVAVHLANWQPVPGLMLLPLVRMGASARAILLSLPRKDAYFRRVRAVLAAHLTPEDNAALDRQFTVAQFFHAERESMPQLRRQRFARRIVPDLGLWKIDHLTSDRVAALHFKLMSLPRVANMMLDDVRAMLRQARTMGRATATHDPCGGIARYRPELQTLMPHDLPRYYAPVPGQYDAASAQTLHDAFFHILDPGDAVLARKPQHTEADTPVPRGAEGVLVRDGVRWAVNWTDFEGRAIGLGPAKPQTLFKRDLRRPGASDALKAAQAALPPDHVIGMQGEVFALPDWSNRVQELERSTGQFIQDNLDDPYSRFLFQPTYIYLKLPWISPGATGPVRQKILQRYEQVDWINLEQLDRLATAMQYVGLMRRRHLDGNPRFVELNQQFAHRLASHDPTAAPIRADLAEIRPREARTFFHLDAAQRVMKGIQDNPELFPDASLATVFRDHLHSMLFEDEIFMDYARTVDYDGSGYFMTHVLFYLLAQNDYDLLPVVFNYLETIQIFQLRQGNVEVAGEIATCLFTILGRRPENSPLLASSLKYLMETAGAQTNWPDRYWTHLTPYKMLHVPWTAIQDLREVDTTDKKLVNRALQQDLLRSIPEWPEFLVRFGDDNRL